MMELFDLTFLAKHENIIFLGPPGVGKTHLATALAVKACGCGFKVLYTTMDTLITKLKENQCWRLSKWNWFPRDHIGSPYRAKRKFSRCLIHFPQSFSLMWISLLPVEIPGSPFLDKDMHKAIEEEYWDIRRQSHTVIIRRFP